MHVEWPGSRCVVCLSAEPLTREHIIPSCLGGQLTCDFLCKTCNSELGAYVESKATQDPSIRLAVSHLQIQIPQLASELMEGQRFISHGPGGKGYGVVRKGEFRELARKEADGSLVQSMEEGRKAVETMLRKSGIRESPLSEALRRFDDAPDDQRIRLARNVEAIKWSVERITPDFSRAVSLNDLVLLKIAFEFLACHLGCAIYDQAQQMAELRAVLRDRNLDDPCFEIEWLHAEEYKPFHGIVFEGNAPYAKVLIRLFGWLAFRVHLKHLAVGGDRFIYTHLLDTSDEDMRSVTDEAGLS